MGAPPASIAIAPVMGTKADTAIDQQTSDTAASVHVAHLPTDAHARIEQPAVDEGRDAHAEHDVNPPPITQQGARDQLVWNVLRARAREVKRQPQRLTFRWRRPNKGWRSGCMFPLPGGDHDCCSAASLPGFEQREAPFRGQRFFDIGDAHIFQEPVDEPKYRGATSHGPYGGRPPAVANVVKKGLHEPLREDVTDTTRDGRITSAARPLDSARTTQSSPTSI